MTRSFKTGLVLALVILIADRITKYWIVEVYDLPLRRSVEVLPFFNLTMVWNRGVSFGMFGGGAVSPWVLLAIVIVIVAFLMVWMARATGLLLTWALGLIVGGALGNGIDRVVYGAVADFFDFHAWGWHFWAFNIADAAISIGVGLLLLDAFFGSGRDQQQSGTAGSDKRAARKE